MLGAFGRRLTVVTAVGAVWRLGYLLAAKWNQELLLNDSLYYSWQASINAEGDWFRHALTGQPGAEHGPLTSLYLTPWSLGAGDDVPWQRLAITLVGITTIVAIGLLGRRLAAMAGLHRRAERIGLVAAAIAAAYPNVWINDSVVMSEALAINLVAWALLLALRHHAAPGVGNGVALGVVAALATLTRSELGLLIAGFALLSLLVARRRRLRVWPAVAIAAAAAVTLAPWTAWNLVRFNEPVLLTTNDGNTLLGANCDTTYFDDIGGWDLLCLGPLAVGSVGHEPGDPDASDEARRRRQEAFDYIGDNLGRLPVVVVARVGRALDVYGLGSLVGLDVGEEKAEWAVWVGIVCWWLLAAGAVAGWRVLAKQHAGVRWWVLVPPLAVLATTIAFYGAHRIRAPAEPAVIILGAVGAVVWWERARAARIGA